MDQTEDHSQGAFRPSYAVRFFLSFFLNFGLLNSFLSTAKKSRNRPSTFQFKSGWDDMLDDKVPKTKIKLSTSIPSCSSPSPTITVSEDDVFKTPALSYLGSPTAKTPSLSRLSVPQNAAEYLKSQTPSPISPTFHKAAVDNPVYSPPNSPLPSIPESCYESCPRSWSPSDLPLEEASGYPL